MIVLEPEEMQKLDQKVINNGFPSLLLMESAGRQTAEIIEDNYNKDNRVLILAGTGNNGGDGFVVARLLDIWNYHVKIIVIGSKEKISGDPLKNIKTCELRDIDINYFNEDNFDEIRDEISNHDLIVDSLLGTGLKGNLREPILSIVRLINESKKQVLSVDIPTGIDGSNGKILKEAVKADITVTMAFSKVGHHLYPGREYTNKLYIVDLGFPEKLIEKSKYKHFVLSLKEASKLLPTRSKTGHKGSFGKVLVIGGSLGYEGAAVLTAESALKSGSGLVKLMVFEEIYQAVSCKKRELITDILTIDNLKNSISDFNVIALGPGLGRGERQEKIVSYIIKNATCPIVIDADGLNNLKLTDLKDVKNDVILTPHPGEFARLIDQSINEVQDNRVKKTREFAKNYNVNLLLKGASTLVVDESGKVTINKTGNNGMATAGSGDVLTGIIASLSGQGLDMYQSGVLGAYLHGLAGDTAKTKLGEYSLLAGDIIDSIPPAISKIKRGVLKMVVAKDIMTTDVITVDPETTVKEAANIMSEHGISGLPIVRDKKLVGIVTENDLIIKDKKLHFPEYINVLGGIIYLESYKKFKEEFKKFTAVKVKELMTKELITAAPDDTLEDIATLMHQKNINRIPVVDNAGQMIGIVTRNNIVKHIASE